MWGEGLDGHLGCSPVLSLAPLRGNMLPDSADDFISQVQYSSLTLLCDYKLLSEFLA